MAIDTFDYFFMFNDRAAAEADSIVGPYFATGNIQEALVYDGTTSSVEPYGGFWALIGKPTPLYAPFQTHPNLQLINDRAPWFAGLPSIVFNTISTIGLIIVISNFCGYGSNFLPQLLVSLYVTEAGDPYVTEDGSSFYVPE